MGRNTILEAVDVQRQDQETTKKELIERRKKEELEAVRGQVKRLLREREEQEHRLEFALGIANHKSKAFEIPRTKGLGSEATSVMVLSDVHVDETVEEGVTNGLNKYTPKIARESVAKFFSNGLRLHQIFSKDIAVHNILLALLGDMISGYIHPELIENNSLSPTQGTIQALDILKSGIQYFKKHCKAKITVVCKFGNHGRTTDKIRISTGYKNSYEWMMYHFLASEFQRDDQVEFIIEDGYLSYVSLYEKYTLRFHHGDAIRYKDGVGGITIPVNKAIANWDKERKAYLDVFGHHHTQMLDAGKFVCNGSVIGYNPYGIYIKAAYERPQQSFFMIDSQRGKTVCAPILVR